MIQNKHKSLRRGTLFKPVKIRRRAAGAAISRGKQADDHAGEIKVRVLLRRQCFGGKIPRARRAEAGFAAVRSLKEKFVAQRRSLDGEHNFTSRNFVK